MNFAVIQNFNLFDIIIALIVGFFSFRGLRRGLTKEGLSMIGLLLGLFFASRLIVESSDFIQDNILKISNTSTLEFVSFLFVFLIIWFSGILLGAIFGKLESANGINFINRLFGFAVGGAKSFFIITILAGIVSDWSLI